MAQAATPTDHIKRHLFGISPDKYYSRCGVKVNRDLGRERGSLLQDQVKNGNINTDKVLSQRDIEAINAALAANQRVEIVMTAKGVKLYNVKRKELNS